MICRTLASAAACPKWTITAQRKGSAVVACVDRGWVVLACQRPDNGHVRPPPPSLTIDVYRLEDGAHVRTLPERLDFFNGGVCLTRRRGGSNLLVANVTRQCVAEVSLDGGGGPAVLRSLGVRSGLRYPDAVACNDTLVAVSQRQGHVFVLGLADGCVVAELGKGVINGQARVCVLSLGGGVAVTEYGKDRVTVFGIDGSQVRGHGLLSLPPHL